VKALADEFEPASRGDWQALVEKSLKGADLASLDSATPDGLVFHPLYASDASPRRFVPAPRSGDQPWDIRAPIRHPSTTAARDAALEALAGGAQSVLLALRHGEVGGIEADSAEALATVLEGTAIDTAPVALDAGVLGPRAADWLSQAVKGSPSAPLALHLDPFSAFARSGMSPGPFESHLISAATTSARLSISHPRASLFLASGAVIHESGGGAARELAFALAAGLAYLKAQVRAGMDLSAAAGRMVIGLAVDADPLVSIAKIRAARLAWTRLLGACGAAAPVVIEVRSSSRMLTRSEPWTNMVRLTSACLAGAIGGADAIVLAAFTDALGLPTSFARRMARNTQLVLMEEARLGAVADPVAGSGAFEALTGDIARTAWRAFNEIEAAGGLSKALCEGLVAAGVEADLDGLRKAIISGDARIVGVTDFKSEEIRPALFEAPPATSGVALDARLPGPDSHCPPLTAIRLEDLADG
jgi:methylmalonyl-CoA mutase